MPRWFVALVILEVAGIAAVAVLGIHLLSAGVAAAGDVVSWARPNVSARSTAPPLVMPRASAPAAVPGALVPVIGSPLFARLNQDTGLTARGQLLLIDQLEEVIRAQVVEAIGRAAAGR